MRVLLIALLAAHALLAWHVRARGVFTFGDDASYILLSRALRSLSYREVQFIGEPIAARFPPGYPAVLALVSLVGERLWLMSLAGIAASVAALIALFDVVRRRWSAQLALLVVGVAAVNPAVVANAGAIASESVFMALTLWSLWAANRAEAGERRYVLACALAIAAALVRSAGVTLLVALGLHWLLRRRYRLVVAFGLASAVTVGSWLAWTVVAPRQEVRRSYLGDAVAQQAGEASFAETMAHRVVSNTRTYVSQIILTEQALPVTRRTVLDNVGWVVVLGTLALAGLVAVWHRWNALFWYCSAYATLLAVWAFPIERFVHPVLPLFVTVVLVGAWSGARRARAGRAGEFAATAMAAVLALCALRADFSASEKAVACDRAWVDCARPESLDFVSAVRYVGTHTPPDARLVAPKNATVYYYASRQTVFWDEAAAQDSATFVPFLERNRAAYVLVTPVFVYHLKLAQLLRANCDRFDLVRIYSPDTMLLVLRPARAREASDGGTPACRAAQRAERRALAAGAGDDA